MLIIQMNFILFSRNLLRNGKGTWSNIERSSIMKDKLELKEVPPLGRSLAEYFLYFWLSELELAGERILDMGAGVSSFCAEMSERGYDVTAVDPIYHLPVELIRQKFKAGLEEVIFQLPEVAHKYNWVFYRDIEDLKRHREKAYISFLHHQHKNPTRYIPASLPETCFQDNEFFITLVSHLLFLFEDRFDYEFHKRSILELARITRREIRIYPLTNLRAERSSLVERLMEDKDFTDLKFAIKKANFEFIKNANEFLVITKGGMAEPGYGHPQET